MALILTAENLACARGGRALFAGLNFTVRGGQALAVEGANGAGKTSLLRMLAGFLSPVEGALTVALGAKTITDAEERGRLIGWLGHQDGLKPQLGVMEQLRFHAGLYGVAADAGALEQVGLYRQRDLPCRYLSAGQKRRLALARLVVSGRPLWLLDEPFAALDAAGQALATRLMTDHCAGGGIVIAATHDPLNLGHESLTL